MHGRGCAPKLFKEVKQRMYKKFLSAALALLLAVSFAAFAACGGGETPKHTVSVDCGEGGSYSITREGEVEDGTRITLSVTPDEGKEVGSVTKNGKVVNLDSGKYSVTVREDIAFKITFTDAEKPRYNVSVTCGKGGTCDLSAEGEVEAGTEITVTVTPDGEHTVSSVRANGEPLSSSDGTTYRFTVNADTEIYVVFREKTGIFAEEYAGVWHSVVTAGGLQSELDVTKTALTFKHDGATDECEVTAEDGEFRFNAEFNDVDTSFTLSFIPITGGRYLARLDYKLRSDELSLYFIKDGADRSGKKAYYTYDFPGDLVAEWLCDGMRNITITSAGELTYGIEGAIVMDYDSRAGTYKLLLSDGIYTLTHNVNFTRLVLVTPNVNVPQKTYTKATFTEKALSSSVKTGEYKTVPSPSGDGHTMNIVSRSELQIDGEKCSVGVYGNSTDYVVRYDGAEWNFSYFGTGKIIIQSGARTMSFYSAYGGTFGVKATTSSTEVNEEGGSWTLSPASQPAGGYDLSGKLTLTVTAAEGYEISRVVIAGSNWSLTDSEGDAVYEELEIKEGNTVEFSVPELYDRMAWQIVIIFKAAQ